VIVVVGYYPDTIFNSDVIMLITGVGEKLEKGEDDEQG